MDTVLDRSILALVVPEHKSWVDHDVLFQLLEYQQRIYNRWLMQKDPGEMAPGILTMVI